MTLPKEIKFEDHFCDKLSKNGYRIRENKHIDIEEYLKREVEKPFIVKDKKIGYEISFTQYFYKYKSLRKQEEVIKEFNELEAENKQLLKELGLL